MQQDISYSRPMKEIPYTLGMDPVRALILEKSQAPGGSLAAWSKAVGKNPTYLQQFITKGSPQKLPEDVRRELARLLNVSEDLLRVAPEGGDAAKGAKAPSQTNARMGGAVALGGTVPAYGHAAGGKDGQFILNGNRISDILAPPSIQDVRGAFAVYVAGNSMEPRYHAGEAVFVNPKLPVRPNDYVVAQILGEEEETPEAYVKRYIGRNSKHLTLYQFNPKKTLIFPIKKVVSVYRIVMGGDG
jgi:phage repressor protein C with HTH and peptisase S24 domain